MREMLKKKSNRRANFVGMLRKVKMAVYLKIKCSFICFVTWMGVS